MRNKLVVSALLLGIILPATSIFGQSSEPVDEGQEIAFMPPPDKQFENPSLNLSKEQKEKIKKIFEENKPEMKKNRKELWEKMKAFRDVYIDDKKTEEDVGKARSEIEGVHKKVMDQHFKTMMQVRAILTSEQRKQFFENMKDRKNKKRKDNKQKD
jgi:Spy/CpxP family protein refolding chaperone